MTKLQQMRAQFTDANHYLWKRRNEYFNRNKETILELIEIGGLKQARTIAEQLVERGIYSPKIGTKAVVRMLVTRLFHELGGDESWEHFSTRLLGKEFWKVRFYRRK